MYFVKISYSFDDATVESEYFKTEELARDELFRLLLDEVRVAVDETDAQVCVIPVGDDPNLIILDYGDGDSAQYRIAFQPVLRQRILHEAKDIALSPKELVYRVGDLYFSIHEIEDGYDYSIYDKNFKLIDGGVYDDPSVSIYEAIDLIVEDDPVKGIIDLLDRGNAVPLDYTSFTDKVES